MKAKLLFILYANIIILGADLQYPPDFTQSKSESDSLLHPILLNPNPNPPRIRRFAFGPFEQTLTRMRKIARLVNAISIQQGLVKGTIPPDDLIAEILNMGSKTVTQIQEFDSKTLKEVAQKIQDLPSLLKKDNDTKKIENRFAVYHSVLTKVNGIKRGFRIPRQYEYFAAVQKLVNAKEDLEDLVDYIKLVQKSFFTIEMLPINKFESNQALFGITIGFQEFRTFKLADFEPLVKDSILREAETIFSTLINVLSANKELINSGVLNYVREDDEIMTKIQENLKTLDGVAKLASTSRSSFLAFEDMIVTRAHFNGSRQLKYLSGFFRAFSNLEEISIDLANYWIQLAVDRQSGFINKDLRTFDTIGSHLKFVKKSLGMYEDDRKNLSEFMKRVEHLSMQSAVFDSLSRELIKIKIESSNSQMQPANTKMLTSLLDNMSKLSRRITSINKIVTFLEMVQSNEKDVDAILAITRDSRVNEALKRHVTLKGTAEFKIFLEVLKSLSSHLDNLSTGPSVVELAKLIPSNSSNDIRTSQSELDTFFNEIDNLRSIKGIDSLGAAVETVRLFRDNPTLNGFLMIHIVDSKIPQIQKDTGILQTFLTSLKNHTTLKNDPLIQLDDLSEISRTIECATRGISNMEKILENEDALTNASQLIRFKRILLDKVDQNNLSKISNLTSFFSSLRKFKNDTKLPISKEFAGQSGIFEAAKEVSGIQDDMEPIVLSIEHLADMSSDPVKSQLKDILPLVGILSFSRYQTDFANAKESLQKLDQFFASYHEKRIQKSVENVGFHEEPVMNSTTEAITETTTWGRPVYLQLCLPLLIFDFFLVGIFIYHHFWLNLY